MAGCIDGTHVLVNPPAGDEGAYVNRHHSKSLNVAMVYRPDYSIYFCSSRCPGRWHDSRVLKESTLWTAFEENAQRPFPGAVILGDSAYTWNSWLIPPFRGDVQGARLPFNEAHKKTRSTIERTTGVIKKGFYILPTGIRVRSILGLHSRDFRYNLPFSSAMLGFQSQYGGQCVDHVVTNS